MLMLSSAKQWSLPSKIFTPHLLLFLFERWFMFNWLFSFGLLFTAYYITMYPYQVSGTCCQILAGAQASMAPSLARTLKSTPRSLSYLKKWDTALLGFFCLDLMIKRYFQWAIVVKKKESKRIQWLLHSLSFKRESQKFIKNKHNFQINLQLNFVRTKSKHFILLSNYPS